MLRNQVFIDLFFFALRSPAGFSSAPQAGRPSLRSGLCLVSLLREPAASESRRHRPRLVSLRVLRSRFASPCFSPGRQAVPALCRRATCGVSPWRRGARPPRPDFWLARRRSPRTDILFSFNVCGRTLIINRDVSTKVGCIIVAARFIAREKRFIARQTRQGWERLCAGLASLQARNYHTKFCSFCR